MNREERARALDEAMDANDAEIREALAAGNTLDDGVSEVIEIIAAYCEERGCFYPDTTVGEFKEAMRRKEASLCAEYDQLESGWEAMERMSAECRRAAVLADAAGEHVDEENMTPGKAVEIIRRHGEEPDPMVLANLYVKFPIPEDRR